MSELTLNTQMGKYSYAGGWILNENNQLDAKSAYDAVVHFAKEGIYV